jgi:hypothetical protein
VADSTASTHTPAAIATDAAAIINARQRVRARANCRVQGIVDIDDHVEPTS